MLLVRTFAFTRGNMPRFTGPISFRPTTVCSPLFVVMRALHCSSSRVPTFSTAVPRRKPARLWNAGRAERTRRGACTVQVRRRRNRGERELVFFLPLSLSPPPPLRRHPDPCAIVPIRTARSHTRSNAASFHCSLDVLSLRAAFFDLPVMSTSRAEAPPFLR